MARACVRNHEFFVAMAEELGEWWMRTIHEAELASESDWRLIERDHMDEAAELLLRAVSELPVPQREVLVRRASGMSWKGIAEALPHRAYFSMTDDWATALRSLWSRQGDLIRRIV